MLSIALGLIFSIALGFILSIALGLILSIALGLILSIALGLILSIALGLILSIALGLILSIALGLILSIVLGLILSIALGLILSITLGLILSITLGDLILTDVILHYRMYSIFVSQNVFQFQLLTISGTHSYLGKTPTNCRYMHEEIKIRLNAGNVSYHSVHNFSSFHFLPKHTEIKIRLSLIFPVSKVCGTWSFTIREDHRLKDIRKYDIKKGIWT
jgi:hypothetical protein